MIAPPTIVQLPGDVLVCDAALFKGVALQSEKLLSLLFRHEQAVYAQAQQSTAAWPLTMSGHGYVDSYCVRGICPATITWPSPRNFWLKCWACGGQASPSMRTRFNMPD
jgi:hypothetical protein